MNLDGDGDQVNIGSDEVSIVKRSRNIVKVVLDFKVMFKTFFVAQNINMFFLQLIQYRNKNDHSIPDISALMFN